MVEETNLRVQQFISKLYLGKHIDEMTKTWLCQRLEPPVIPTVYTLTKLNKLIPVGRPVL